MIEPPASTVLGTAPYVIQCLAVGRATIPIFSHCVVLAHAIPIGNAGFVKVPASGVIVWLLCSVKPGTPVQIPFSLSSKRREGIRPRDMLRVKQGSGIGFATSTSEDSMAQVTSLSLEQSPGISEYAGRF